MKVERKYYCPECEEHTETTLILLIDYKEGNDWMVQFSAECGRCGNREIHNVPLPVWDQIAN